MIRAGVALTAAALTGCAEDWGLLGVQARALAEGAAEEAGPPLRAAVGMSALAATLCRFSEADWQAMPKGEPRLPDPLVSWFGAKPAPIRLSQAAITAIIIGGVVLVVLVVAGVAVLGKPGKIR